MKRYRCYSYLTDDEQGDDIEVEECEDGDWYKADEVDVEIERLKGGKGRWADVEAALEMRDKEIARLREALEKIKRQIRDYESNIDYDEYSLIIKIRVTVTEALKGEEK